MELFISQQFVPLFLIFLFGVIVVSLLYKVVRFLWDCYDYTSVDFNRYKGLVFLLKNRRSFNL